MSHKILRINDRKCIIVDTFVCLFVWRGHTHVLFSTCSFPLIPGCVTFVFLNGVLPLLHTQHGSEWCQESKIIPSRIPEEGGRGGKSVRMIYQSIYVMMMMIYWT